MKRSRSSIVDSPLLGSGSPTRANKRARTESPGVSLDSTLRELKRARTDSLDDSAPTDSTRTLSDEVKHLDAGETRMPSSDGNPPPSFGARTGQSSSAAHFVAMVVSARDPQIGVRRTSMPWLRSGRTFAHPLVAESATMQVQPLSAFELSVSTEGDRTDDASSDQSTVTERWSAVSPARSFSSTRSLSSTGTLPYEAATPSPPRQVEAASPPLQTETIVSPPGRVVAIAPHRYRYTGTRAVDRWYEECFVSDGYDSDAIGQIGTPPKRETPSTLVSTPRPVPASADSSPGFQIIGDTSLRSARDEWRPDSWPQEVMVLTSQYNPQRLAFPKVSSGFNGGAGCGCGSRCNATSCLNAQCSRFCNAVNCPFRGDCGNALRESAVLKICRNVRTGSRGVVATAAIPAGEVLGEYFGHLQYFGVASKGGPVNEGYRLRLKTKTTGNKHVGLDALHAGGKLRLLNHSCNPCARFHEVQTGRELTVVTVTTRDVYPGEEVTVTYGDRLWFICRCGWWGCQHRDLQHLTDMENSQRGI